MSKNPTFYPVILAGGRGTRFWPLSRKKRAKQLLALDGKQTMIQQTVARLLPLAPPKKFWVITNDDLRPVIVKQLPKLPKPQVLAEPVGRNTAPAIGLAAFLLFSAYIDKVNLILGNQIRAGTRPPGTLLASVNLADVSVFIAALIGSMLVYFFSSLAIRAVGTTAQSIIVEVRRQFREMPGIMDYTQRPDYARVVDITTRAALRQKFVRRNGTWKNGEWRSDGLRWPSSRPSTIVIASRISTSVVAFANAGSASAGWPT